MIVNVCEHVYCELVVLRISLRFYNCVSLFFYFLLLWSLLIVKLLSFTCLLVFLVTIMIFGELTSTTSKERITDIIFVGATPIN